jgi:hypothetical protein
MFFPQVDFGKLTLGIPRLQYSKIVLAESQVRSLFSVPIQIAPAIPGLAHYPLGFSIYREAGTGYTVGGAGNPGWYIGANAFLTFAIGFLSGAGPYSAVSIAPAFVSFSIVSNTQDNTNQALLFKTTVNDLTGGTGRLTVETFWRSFPNGPLGVAL